MVNFGELLGPPSNLLNVLHLFGMRVYLSIVLLADKTILGTNSLQIAKIKLTYFRHNIISIATVRIPKKG